MSEPVKSEQPQVSEQPSEISPGNAPKPTLAEILGATWDYIKSHFRSRTWAGWLLFIFAFFPDWQSRIVSWVGYLDQIGGHAAMLGDALTYAPPVLAIAGVCYILVIAYLVEEHRARQWMSLAAWTVVIVSAVVFGSLALFVDFVQSSKIPAAMEYLAEKGRIRTVSPEQASSLQAQAQRIKDQMSEFSFLSQRDTETLQFAYSIFSVLEAAHLKMTYGGQEQTRPSGLPSFSERVEQQSSPVPG